MLNYHKDKAALSCSLNVYRLGVVRLGFGTTGKVGRPWVGAWVVHGVVHGAWCMEWWWCGWCICTMHHPMHRPMHSQLTRRPKPQSDPT